MAERDGWYWLRVSFVAGDLFAPGDQPRAGAARGDGGVMGVERVHCGTGRGRWLDDTWIRRAAGRAAGCTALSALEPRGRTGVQPPRLRLEITANPTTRPLNGSRWKRKPFARRIQVFTHRLASLADKTKTSSRFMSVLFPALWLSVMVGTGCVCPLSRATCSHQAINRGQARHAVMAALWASSGFIAGRDVGGGWMIPGFVGPPGVRPDVRRFLRWSRGGGRESSPRGSALKSPQIRPPAR